MEFTIRHGVSVIVGVFVLIAILFDVELNSAALQRLPNRKDRWSRLSKWLPGGLAYSLFYMTRYSIVAGNNSVIREQLGFQSQDFGLVLAAGFWTYAATALFTGMVADRVGGRAALLVSVAGAASCNLFLGIYFATVASPSVALFAVGYAGNIFFQGFGTAAVVKVNATLYSKEERGVFSGVYNVMITSGYYLALAICPQMVSGLGWSYAFFLPAAALGLVFVVVYLFTPYTLAPVAQLSEGACEAGSEVLADAEEHDEMHAAGGVAGVLISVPSIRATTHLDVEAQMKGVESGASAPAVVPAPPASSVQPLPSTLQVAPATSQPTSKPTFAQSLTTLMTTPSFPLFLLAIMCCSYVRDGLLAWMYAFFESRSQDPSSALDGNVTALIGGAVTLGGFFGGISCGLLSDKCFQGRRLPPVLMYSIGQLFALIGLYSTAGSSAGVTAVFVFFTSCFLLGQYTMISYTVPADLPTQVVGTGCGLLTVAAYIASGVSGLSMSKSISSLGYLWGWMALLVTATTIGMILVVLAIVGRRPGCLKQPSKPTAPSKPEVAEV